MPQSLVFILLLASNSFASSPKEIVKIYDDFESKKDELLKSKLDKKTAKDKIVPAYQALEKALDEVKAIESKAKNDLLTTEGNQMAYDLEILSPIKDLAAGLISKEECEKARHEHALNFPVTEDEDSKAILSTINKICSE